MKKLMTLLLSVCMMILCACDNTQVYGDTQVEATDYTEEIIQYSYIGRWDSESEYWYFLENDKCCFVELTRNGGETAYHAGRLAFCSGNNEGMAVSFSGPVVNSCDFGLTYSISGDELVSSDVVFTRSAVSPVQYGVDGTWQLVGRDGDFESFKYPISTNEYIRTFHFYGDNTYQAEWYFDYKNEENFKECRYGSYNLVNDGQVLCFDGRIYYECNLLGYGLMELIDPSGNSLLYILQ